MGGQLINMLLAQLMVRSGMEHDRVLAGIIDSDEGGSRGSGLGGDHAGRVDPFRDQALLIAHAMIVVPHTPNHAHPSSCPRCCDRLIRALPPKTGERTPRQESLARSGNAWHAQGLVHVQGADHDDSGSLLHRAMA